MGEIILLLLCEPLIVKNHVLYLFINKNNFLLNYKLPTFFIINEF
jgi:hypothetical protein